MKFYFSGAFGSFLQFSHGTVSVQELIIFDDYYITLPAGTFTSSTSSPFGVPLLVEIIAPQHTPRRLTFVTATEQPLGPNEYDWVPIPAAVGQAITTSGTLTITRLL